MISFGTYPDVSLLSARQRRTDVRTLIADGANPSEVRRAEKLEQKATATNTFKLVASEWHQHKVNRWTAGYASDIWEGLENPLH
ncbi:MAG: integrase arm-type DNA-binding domain-containing protein [Enterobacteriaceae bacterium]|jgi:hypothetical protein|nr:integrase arm-type DNA-binding domain-containing protein [Enterobacteriaceae bacterium]